MNLDGRFSVYQFFQDGSYERVRSRVGLLNAVQGAVHYCSSAAVKLGMVSRVIITDNNDNCVFEWKEKEGVVFPSELTEMFNHIEHREATASLITCGVSET